MADIAKLDYSKPPSERSAPGWNARDAQGKANLWAFYKRHNDPPGMSLVRRSLRQGSVVQEVWCFTPAVDVSPEWSWSIEEGEARAAAWDWYDTRLGLANTHDAAWPECLEYTKEICAEVLESPHHEEAKRQSAEHAAESLALMNFSDAPPGWVKDPISGWAHEPDTSPDSKCRRRPIDVAWTHYKAEHNPPGMWCGFARAPLDLEICNLRAGVSACGGRWELSPDLRVPYKGYLAKCREWAWAWHDRRHALARDLIASQDLLRSIGKEVKFHVILVWHDEWVTEAEAWVKDKSRPIPEAFLTLKKREEVCRG